MIAGYRFLLALIAMFASYFISLPLFGSLFSGPISLFVFGYTFLKINSPKERLRAQNAIPFEEFHPNGVISVKGKMIFGKKEEDWKYYSEEGKLIKEEVYNDGYLMRTIDHTE
jgi:hypothetical protein